jgi:WhiB family redox-sensing transcriptional regulator
MTLAFAPLDRETIWLDGGLSTELPCRQYDPDLWFADAPADLEVAKTLCGACPLKAECLAGAIERAEPWGVWGGEIFERGAIVPRKRPRGRPRKEDLARDVVLRVEVANRTNALLGAEGLKVA